MHVNKENKEVIKQMLNEDKEFRHSVYKGFAMVTALVLLATVGLVAVAYLLFTYVT